MSKKNVVYLNQVKWKRAEIIIFGSPKSIEEKETQEKFHAKLAEAEVKIPADSKKGEEAIAFVYDLLGGATRTYEEHAKATAAARTAAKANKVNGASDDESEDSEDAADVSEDDEEEGDDK